MPEGKARFRDGLKAFYNEYYKIDEGKLSGLQRSNGLGLFYITHVLNKTNPGQFPEDFEELEGLITDGPNDQGADFCYRVDGHTYIIQIKYRKKKTIEDDKEVRDFSTILERLHPETGKSCQKNQKLMDFISEIDWDTDNFSLWFISLGRSNKDIENIVNSEIPKIQHPDFNGLEARSNFSFLGEEDLNVEYRDAMNVASGTKLSVTLSLLKGESSSPWFKYINEKGYICYIGAINAGQIHGLWQHKGNRNNLFTLNIRNFIGDTSTNKEIMNTAKKEPINFFFYNNGISAICQKIEADEEEAKLKCESFSIINGAQTFRSISKSHSDPKSNLKNLAVMIRVTEAPILGKPEAGDFFDKITLYNNTQNAIKAFDFRSNDKVQTSLMQHFSKISYMGKNYHYKIKRTDESSRNKINVKLDDFCKAVHSFCFGPPDFFGGTRYLYNTNKDGGYFRLFGEGNEIRETLSKEFLDYYSAIYFICEYAKLKMKTIKEDSMKVERRLKDKNDESPLISKQVLEKILLVYFSLKEVLEQTCKVKDVDFKLLILRYSSPGWRDDQKKSSIVDDALNIASDLLINAYQIRSQQKNFSQRDWSRQKTTLEEIRNGLLARSSEVNHLALKIL